MSFSVELQSKVDEWLKWDKNPVSRSEIEKLVEIGDERELKSRLLSRMEFGTAGLRSRMGAGYSMMNDLTIIQTSQGFLHYLKTHFGAEHLNKHGIVIGYDARHNSYRFAQLSANIFMRANVRVYLFRQITPTPFVPYAVLRYACCAGIMITASHNPKEDNGYKVYFDNGAQIISPHDKQIAKSIRDHLEPEKDVWSVEYVDSSELRTDPYDDVFKSYFEDLQKLCYHKELNSQTSLIFTYTAMHGVGYQFSLESFRSFGHKAFVPVAEQVQPDPDFPTVTFPNPEEGKSALNLAIRTADAAGSTIILANDPDADRLAVAEKDKDGAWKIFNGNEIGALLGWWMWESYKRKHENDIDWNGKDAYMLYSTVSSHVLRAIAEKEGFSCQDTLTGFKWMGNMTHDLIKQKKHVLFCFEEAIGFMCGTNVLDKDGISAEAIVAELAVYLNHVENKTLAQKLQWIYEYYGLHVSNNSYYVCYEQQHISNMFHRLRHFKQQGDSNSNEEFTYPKYCGPYKIDKIRDLTAGVVVDFKNNGQRSVPSFPTSKSSEMITFYLENGCVMTIRTSGTEPKIKWYTEIRQLEKLKTRDQTKEELDDVVKHMIEEFYQPEKNNFKARST